MAKCSSAGNRAGGSWWAPGLSSQVVALHRAALSICLLSDLTASFSSIGSVQFFVFSTTWGNFSPLTCNPNPFNARGFDTVLIHSRSRCSLLSPRLASVCGWLPPKSPSSKLRRADRGQPTACQPAVWPRGGATRDHCRLRRPRSAPWQGCPPATLAVSLFRAAIRQPYPVDSKQSNPAYTLEKLALSATKRNQPARFGLLIASLWCSRSLLCGDRSARTDFFNGPRSFDRGNVPIMQKCPPASAELRDPPEFRRGFAGVYGIRNPES